MRLETIHCGNFKLDGGAMFGTVPKSIWKNLALDYTIPNAHISGQYSVFYAVHNGVIYAVDFWFIFFNWLIRGTL